jgi:sugar/nucleoside kinase (ribokinase family)
MKIAVIGDHCLDIDYIGEYDGLMSREIEKLPVFNCGNVRYSGGGAANIVELLAGLGAKVFPVGAYGDIEGDILMDKVWQARDETWDKDQTVNWMVEGQPTPSFIKFYQKSGQHIFRMNKKSLLLNPNIEEKIIYSINHLDVDATIVADYDETGNGIVTGKILAAVSKKECKLKIGTSRSNIKRLLDTHDFHFVFGNEKEVTPGDLYSSTRIIVTRGGFGSYISYVGGIWASSASDPLVKDIDICGCGDSFLSAFVIKKLNGESDLECLKWANAAGRAQARKLFGAHTLSWEEIIKEHEELYGKSMA